jgi:hypothetical protein
VVAPAGIVTFAAERVSVPGSLTDSVTVNPPAGAGPGSAICRDVDWPSPMAVAAGITREPVLLTVTEALAGRIPGVDEEAVIVAEPCPAPFTGTGTLLLPWAIVTDGGTVAAVVLLETRFTVTLDGAGTARLSVNDCVCPTLTNIEAGVKLRPDPTVTTEESPVSPGADAEIVATPNPAPATVAADKGSMAPAGIVIDGLTVTRVVSLLVSVTVTPPAGAGVARLTPIGTVCPGATLTFF